MTRNVADVATLEGLTTLLEARSVV